MKKKLAGGLKKNIRYFLFCIVIVLTNKYRSINMLLLYYIEIDFIDVNVHNTKVIIIQLVI